MQSTRFQAFKRIELNYAVIKELFISKFDFSQLGFIFSEYRGFALH